MNWKAVAAAVLVAWLAMPASAHRVDEYLQATLLSIEKDHVEVFLRLVPGIAVSSAVLAGIDADGDGVISEAERQLYAQRVLADLHLTIDGTTLTPKLVSVDFPDLDAIKEGLGEIQLTFSAALPSGGPNRKLVFENHHQPQIAAYLVNCLTPRDRNIRVLTQLRNQDQSFYHLDYAQAAPPAEAIHFKGWSSVRGWMIATALSLLAGVVLLSRQPLIALLRGARHAS